jgi:hypothetical protein
MKFPALGCPAAIAGLALVVLGSAVNIMGRFALGRNWGNQVIIYQDHTLVTGGMYRFVRHPLYASLIWMFIGASLVFQNWASLLATLFIFLPAMYYRGKLEEKALIAQFPGYAEYRDRTGMFFPISMGPEVVQIPRPAFAFCRISLTVILWVALYFHSVWLVAGGVCHSGVVGHFESPAFPDDPALPADHAPVFPTQHYVFLDVPAMRFAHGMGAVMALAVVVAMLALPKLDGIAWLFCVAQNHGGLWLLPGLKVVRLHAQGRLLRFDQGTSARNGFATRSSASGRTGRRNACPSRATGMRATCTSRATPDYEYPRRAPTAIRRSSASWKLTTSGRRRNGSRKS